MKIDTNLLKEFASLTNDSKETKTENVYGIVTSFIEDNGTIIVVVKIDGSDLELSCDSTVDVSIGDRVMVTIDKNHPTVVGNISNPSIYAATVTADDIITGTLKSKDGISTNINLDDGTFSFGKGAITWDGTKLVVGGYASEDDVSDIVDEKIEEKDIPTKSDISDIVDETIDEKDLPSKSDIPSEGDIQVIINGTVDASYVNALGINAKSIVVKDGDNIIFEADADTKKVTIADFTAINDGLYTGEHSTIDSEANGSYFGSDGLSMGKDFKVTPDGKLYLTDGLYVPNTQAWSEEEYTKILDWVMIYGSQYLNVPGIYTPLVMTTNLELNQLMFIGRETPYYLSSAGFMALNKLRMADNESTDEIDAIWRDTSGLQINDGSHNTVFHGTAANGGADLIHESSNLRPTDNSKDKVSLGTASHRFKDVYANTGNFSGDMTVGGNLNVTGSFKPGNIGNVRTADPITANVTLSTANTVYASGLQVKCTLGVWLIKARVRYNAPSKAGMLKAQISETNRSSGFEGSVVQPISSGKQGIIEVSTIYNNLEGGHTMYLNLSSDVAGLVINKDTTEMYAVQIA